MLLRWTKLAVWAAVFMTLVAATSYAQDLPPIQITETDLGGVPKIQIKTDLVNYQFSADDAVLDSAYIHFNTFDTMPTELIPGVTTNADTFFPTVPAGLVLPFRLNLDEQDDDFYNYEIAQNVQGEITLIFTRLSGELEITKTFTIKNTPYYRVDFNLSLSNTGTSALVLDQGYTMTLTTGLASVSAPEEVFLANGDRVNALPQPPYAFGGAGFLGEGLALFLKNETQAISANTTVLPSFSVDPGGRKVLGTRVGELELSGGESADYSYVLYAGRWKYVLMAESGLETVAGKGPFSQFLVPMIQGLEWLFRWTGNYGWAIIIFTLLTRVVMFPLLRQQFHAMAKMRELQPKLNRLKERYPTLNELRKLDKDADMGELQAKAKDNREKMQKKMMELYQKEGINPLSGCLPSLIQLPFLILLWRTILYSAESVHFSPGFMWMNDLSQPDPLYILVGITAVVMVFQTRMTPQMGTGSQNQLLMWMFPIMMVVFLKDFPAGLWLYYFLTTAIQVIQQMFINREIADKKPAVETPDENDKEDDAPAPETVAEATPAAKLEKESK